MIKVLIVDDSKTVSMYLESILSSDPEIEVVGKAYNGKQAIALVEKNKPDIVTMDIDMPTMGGLEATRKIMELTPVPIIVVTAGRNLTRENLSIDALAAGALTVVYKPVGIGHPSEEIKTKRLITLVKTYSQVKVVRRRMLRVSDPKPQKIEPFLENTAIPQVNTLLSRKYLAIGVSSGGPPVLEEILSEITPDFPYPILIVQHITVGFLESMVSWLNRHLSLPVSIASEGELALPGHVYFAPDNFQMGLSFNKFRLEHPDSRQGICPSVEYLFNSLNATQGKDVIALMLTGMGSDGAEEMKKLRESGALTIAQDKESSLVHGMPGEAIKLGGVDHVLNIDQIKQVLQEIENGSKKRGC